MLEDIANLSDAAVRRLIQRAAAEATRNNAERSDIIASMWWDLVMRLRREAERRGRAREAA